MSDAAVIVNVVTGAVTIVTAVVGFLTLWVKLRYAGDKAGEAVASVKTVESKLDANTRTTEAVDAKAATIVEQTNGVTAVLQASVNQLLDRVEKLEGYNRDSSHRVMDAVQAMHLKIAAMGATTAPAPPPPPETTRG